MKGTMGTWSCSHMWKAPDKEGDKGRLIRREGEVEVERDDLS
jgi:hypothetical protein